MNEKPKLRNCYVCEKPGFPLQSLQSKQGDTLLYCKSCKDKHKPVYKQFRKKK